METAVVPPDVRPSNVPSGLGGWLVLIGIFQFGSIIAASITAYLSWDERAHYLLLPLAAPGIDRALEMMTIGAILMLIGYIVCLFFYFKKSAKFPRVYLIIIGLYVIVSGVNYY